MNNIIYYDNFISNKKILHADNVNNYTDALIFYINNKKNFDIITYNNFDQFSLLNVDILKKDNNDNYYYEYSVPKIGDIIDNIHIECLIQTKINYYINNYEYKSNEFDEFIFVAAPYSELKIRITFLEIPKNNTEFIIKSTNYILNNEDIKKLSSSKVITKKNIYNEGICISKPNKLINKKK